MSAYNRGSSEEIKLGKRKEIRREDIKKEESIYLYDRIFIKICVYIVSMEHALRLVF